MTEDIFIYDGSFEGFLTAVFEVVSAKSFTASIARSETSNLFAACHPVTSDGLKASRVLAGLEKRISGQALADFFAVWLSELPEVETVLLTYALDVFASHVCVEGNFSNSNVITFNSLAKKVGRESHRMEAFVRFQRSAEDVYYAGIEPDFNVLPLIREHFRKRYADQKWIIYDLRRRYGFYYDLASTVIIEPSESILPKFPFNADETSFQDLWKTYFSSVNIASRKNMPLHIRHIPYRYWKLLTEKDTNNN